MHCDPGYAVPLAYCWHCISYK